MLQSWLTFFKFHLSFKKVDPVYISEISPAKYRGYLVTWSEIAINTGIVLGFSMGIFFANVETGAQVCF